MIVFGETAVIQRRDLVVKRIYPGVEIGRGEVGLERLASDSLMGAPKNGLGFRPGLEPVSFGKEAVPGDSWRIIGQEPVAARKLHDRFLDLACSLAGRCSRQDGHPAFDPAPGWNRGCPVAALDSAHVEIERMLPAAT